MKVSLEVLGRVYDNMRNQGDRSLEDSKETLDPNSHLHVVDAFDMPLWNWSGERGTFEKLFVIPFIAFGFLFSISIPIQQNFISSDRLRIRGITRTICS